MSSPNNKGMKVLMTNGLSLLQDIGRTSYSHYGVSQSGGVDSMAYFWSNALLGNKHDAVAIEITLGGFSIEAQMNTCIALCGADLEATINDRKVALWQTHNIKAGDIIKWKKRNKGLRCYLGIKGGFKIAHHLGSASTNTREKIGGLHANGEPLMKDDIIPYESSPHQPTKSLGTSHIPHYGNSITLKLIPSYQYHSFSPSYREAFLSSTYVLSTQINRVGCRLQVPNSSKSNQQHNIELPYSEGMLIGAIQVPPNGEPIIMLNDAPTIGGYPKIGTVAQQDLPKLAQGYSNNIVKFQLSSIST